MSLHALALELNLFLALAGALLALLRSGPSPGRRTYAGLALAGALWCGGELLGVRGHFEGWLGTRMAFLGLVGLGPLWIGVAAHLAGLPLARRVPWFPVALATPGLALWLLLMWEPWSALVLRGPREPGPLWWVYTLYSYALVLGGCAIHLGSGLRVDDGRRRWQRIAIGLAGLLPLAVHATHALRGFPGAYDPTPIVLTPVGVALATALFPGGLLELRRIERDLIDHLPLGVVLADRRGVVVDLNPAAEALLGLSTAEAAGRSLEAILSAAPAATRVEVSPVRLAGREVGRFALLQPTAGGERAAERTAA